MTFDLYFGGNKHSCLERINYRMAQYSVNNDGVINST